VLDIAAPDPSRPQLPSVPDPGAAAEGDGDGGMPELEERDAVDPPSTNRTIHSDAMAGVDLPPQFLSLPSVTDSAPSLRELIVERTGDHHSQPHGRDDIV